MNELSEHYSRCLNTEYGKTQGVKFLNIMGTYREISSPHPDQLHLSQVVVNAGGKIYIINANGLQELDGDPTWLGTSVFMQFYGEGQGIFETQYQFHKGYVFTETMKIAEQNPQIDEEDYDVEEWEDVIMENDIPRESIVDQDIWRN